MLNYHSLRSNIFCFLWFRTCASS